MGVWASAVPGTREATDRPRWLTILPATYALLRCVVLLEQGRYDDPTELATSDRPFQIAAGAFVLLAGSLMYAHATRML